jgi:hypothetical protein
MFYCFAILPFSEMFHFACFAKNRDAKLNVSRNTTLWHVSLFLETEMNQFIKRSRPQLLNFASVSRELGETDPKQAKHFAKKPLVLLISLIAEQQYTVSSKNL